MPHGMRTRRRIGLAAGGLVAAGAVVTAVVYGSGGSAPAPEPTTAATPEPPPPVLVPWPLTGVEVEEMVIRSVTICAGGVSNGNAGTR